LEAPDSIKFSFAAGVLSVTGEAPSEWIAKLHAEGPALPGVDRLATQGLSSSTEAALRTLLQEVEALHVTFAPSVSAIDPAQAATVEALAEKVRSALALAESSGAKLQVALVGRADEVGPLQMNRRLSERRARDLQRALIARGLPAAQYPARGEMVEAGRQRTAGVEIRLTEPPR
jgi:outer membrane protein OmpA-like peptidoglycan-associated protein